MKFTTVPVKLLCGCLFLVKSCGNINSLIKLSSKFSHPHMCKCPIHSNAFSIFFAMNTFYFYNLIQIMINVTLRGKKRNPSSRKFGHKGGVEELVQEIQQGFSLFNFSLFFFLTSSVLFGILYLSWKLPDSKNTLIGCILEKFIKVSHLLVSE